MSRRDGWLPAGFVHPTRIELPTGHHLRPIRATDVDIDYAAVMGSQARLWERFGATWGWPPADMTLEQDRADLARHEVEIEAHESFNYAVLDADERELLGCVYIDPVPDTPTAASVAWWVVDAAVGTALESTLEDFVPRWLASEWPFASVDYD